MKFCWKCGSQLNDEAVFCVKCGAKQTDENANSSNGEEVIVESSAPENPIGEKISEEPEKTEEQHVGQQSSSIGTDGANNAGIQQKEDSTKNPKTGLNKKLLIGLVAGLLLIVGIVLVVVGKKKSSIEGTYEGDFETLVLSADGTGRKIQSSYDVVLFEYSVDDQYIMNNGGGYSTSYAYQKEGDTLRINNNNSNGIWTTYTKTGSAPSTSKIKDEKIESLEGVYGYNFGSEYQIEYVFSADGAYWHYGDGQYTIEGNVLTLDSNSTYVLEKNEDSIILFRDKTNGRMYMDLTERVSAQVDAQTTQAQTQPTTTQAQTQSVTTQAQTQPVTQVGTGTSGKDNESTGEEYTGMWEARNDRMEFSISKEGDKYQVSIYVHDGAADGSEETMTCIADNGRLVYSDGTTILVHVGDNGVCTEEKWSINEKGYFELHPQEDYNNYQNEMVLAKEWENKHSEIERPIGSFLVWHVESRDLVEQEPESVSGNELRYMYLATWKGDQFLIQNIDKLSYITDVQEIENNQLSFRAVYEDGESKVSTNNFYGNNTQKLKSGEKIDAKVFSAKTNSGATLYLDYFPNNGLIRITDESGTEHYYSTDTSKENNLVLIGYTTAQSSKLGGDFEYISAMLFGDIVDSGEYYEADAMVWFGDLQSELPDDEYHSQRIYFRKDCKVKIYDFESQGYTEKSIDEWIENSESSVFMAGIERDATGAIVSFVDGSGF